MSGQVLSPFVSVPPATTAIRDLAVHEIRQHLQIIMAMQLVNKATQDEITKRCHRISALLITG
jgi:hypothetical protein